MVGISEMLGIFWVYHCLDVGNPFKQSHTLEFHQCPDANGITTRRQTERKGPGLVIFLLWEVCAISLFCPVPTAFVP